MREPGTAILNVPSAEQMQAVGHAIGRAIDALDAPFIIALEGELGAGKTTLVGGLLRAYGITGPVRSPTYTLIEPYEATSRPLYHLDLYRLTDPDEMEPLGVRDLLIGRAVLLIEWPSRAGAALPAADLWIEISYPAAGIDGRQVRLTPHSSNGAAVMRQMVAAIPELRLLSP
ncbi:tRNA (adenosine(37)-N6)-threonylcarbamoyltransferase complex ATPase subunit type 1 TsaE [Steroidobacter sp. S1-65]|uniref:tRNA threonylcarbamoyladenosine biosynthesis protein TsaE n=1 Tax=Steroidobacter gossypii TaxID=2805490 RepID=A0ABS1X6B0_9GAMM|nr:tRNA (adenosine(37)-N6)-threonylcarbamoyltransferase complex ATPase subunit type 1 TsaE [Steroidobacter gossypii]MBM0108757.1 tRNA (adenosine(37)-N6)-threonylcarbamoyltransferase complex ATPase subunit type 1 TsaE [Steroidobacter gossypii]